MSAPQTFNNKIIKHCKQFASVIPILDFRHDETSLYANNFQAFQTFISSGTTSEIAFRSKSRFSEEGIERYKKDALKNFFALPNLPKQGISLIPSILEWPDSSLAHMVAWIAEVVPVTYCDAKDLALSIGTKPVWIFGTAFHYVNLYDQKLRVNLPEGSIAIETGGTKNQSREVSAVELESIIHQSLSVRTANIFSEYGMCELASQAYGSSQHLSQGRMRFPENVNLSVLQSDLKLHDKGEGTLCVRDSSRIDINHAILTEDRVHLFDDRSFNILGRVDKAPLKGCSLNLLEIKNQNNIYTELKLTGEKSKLSFSDLQNFFSQKDKIKSLLKVELGSLQLASACYEDLVRSMPKSEAEYTLAVTRSGGSQFKNICFILPENHSIVGLYPLSLALSLSAKISIKPPRKTLPLLNYFLDFFKDKFIILNSSTKFDGEKLDFDRVFIYGDTVTKSFFETKYPSQAKVHGPGMTVTIAESNSLDVESLAYDCVALRQRGCKSCRGLILIGSDNRPWEKDFLHEIKVNYSDLSNEASNARLVYEYLHNDLNYISKPQDGFLIVKKNAADLNLENFFARQELTLPFCNMNWEELFNHLQKTSINRIITTTKLKTLILEKYKNSPYFAAESSTFSNIEFIEPGTSQILIWDGIYENRPLFGD